MNKLSKKQLILNYVVNCDYSNKWIQILFKIKKWCDRIKWLIIVLNTTIYKIWK